MLSKKFQYVFVLFMVTLLRGTQAYVTHFKTIVNSLIPWPPPHPELVDYFFYIQQLNISHRVIVGKMNVSQAIGPLMVSVGQQGWTFEGFKEISSGVQRLPGCLTTTLAGILKSFKPKGKFNETSCSFPKGNYELDMDFDQVLHTQYDKTQLERIIISLKFETEEEKPLFALIIDFENQSLRSYEFQMGRGEEYLRRIGKLPKENKDSKKN